MKILPARNIDSRDVEGIVRLKLCPMCMASESHSAITVEEKDCFPKRNLVMSRRIWHIYDQAFKLDNTS